MIRRHGMPFIFTLGSLIAAGGFGCGETTPSNPPDSTPGVPPDESTPGGPQIVSLAVNTSRLGPTETLAITAIVTDPDGIEDVIGGELALPNGTTLGPFSTSSQEGAYGAKLTWADVKIAQDLTNQAGEQAVVFVARFFDQATHVASKSVTVVLACDSNQLSLCDGACVNLDTDEDHCGACFHELPGTSDLVCQDGEAACSWAGDQLCGNGCVSRTDAEHCGSCNNNCQQRAVAIGATAGECTSAGRCSVTRAMAGSSLTCAAMCQQGGLTCEGVDISYSLLGNPAFHNNVDDGCWNNNAYWQGRYTNEVTMFEAAYCHCGQ